MTSVDVKIALFSSRAGLPAGLKLFASRPRKLGTRTLSSLLVRPREIILPEGSDPTSGLCC